MVTHGIGSQGMTDLVLGVMISQRVDVIEAQNAGMLMMTPPMAAAGI